MPPFAPPVHRPPHVREYRDAERRAFDAKRGSASQRGYDSTWERLRKSYLARNPLCVLCLEAGHIVQATVADHIIRVRDAPERRLDESNLRPLCKRHHDAHTARQVGFARGRQTPCPREGRPRINI
jgi:5-methylcytosine-specific restriction protein A